jgi:hypothetical protein
MDLAAMLASDHEYVPLTVCPVPGIKSMPAAIGHCTRYTPTMFGSGIMGEFVEPTVAPSYT